MIRVDGDDEIGLGHVMRCISIAEAFDANHFKIVFLSASLSAPAKSQIENAGFNIRMLKHQNSEKKSVNEIINVAALLKSNKIVIDIPFNHSARENQDFINLIHGLCLQDISVAMIDGLDHDCASMQVKLSANLIIIPYLNAEHRDYLISPKTKLLAGAQYFPFSKKFAPYVNKSRAINASAKRVLICYGGGNVKAENLKLLDGFQKSKTKDWQITITGALDNESGRSLDLTSIRHASNIPELLFSADFAVIGSGLMRYEAALLGTPSIVFSRSDHHAKLVKEFSDANLCVDGGILNDISSFAIANMFDEFSLDLLGRNAMHEKRFLLDIYGKQKIVEAIISMPLGAKK